MHQAHEVVSVMTRNAEIIIIGGGIIGLSTAFQLARRSPAKIIVLEKGTGPGEGSTGASSAVCRCRYTHRQMVQLARDGIDSYRNWPDFLEIEDPLARFHPIGVLWIGADRVGGEAQRLAGLGIRAAVLDDHALQERFPALNPCVVAPDLETGAPHDCRGGGRHLLELDGGYIDPMDALQDLIAATRRKGVDLRFRAEVSGITVKNGRVEGVTLKSGERIGCGALVNAAGPWCNAVFEMAGLKHGWPLTPCRIQMFHVARPPELQADIPVCGDLAAGIYFRPQSRGQEIIAGSVLEEDEREAVGDPDIYARHADDGFIRAKLHALQHRLPGLTVRGRVRGYSGLYTINRADMHPVVGRTEIAGFYAANGFSGHGFKLAPAVGSLLAREITGQGAPFDTQADPHFLAFDRTPIALASKNVLA